MTQNIEQRTAVAVKRFENTSEVSERLAMKDEVVQTAAGPRNSLPKVSREAEEKFSAQRGKHEQDFQERWALSQQAIPWVANTLISDALQRYSIGVVGAEGYKEFLPSPEKLPFETSDDIEQDISLGRWLENGVPSKNWVETYTHQLAGEPWQSTAISGKQSVKNKIYLYQTEDGFLVQVKDPEGGNDMGDAPEFPTFIQVNQDRSYITFEEFGCKGYPNDDTAAFEKIQSYLDSLTGVLPIVATKPAYMTRKGLIVRPGKEVKGQGCDYWDTWRPNENELIKSMDVGTSILFAGEGEKSFSAINLDDNTPKKSAVFNGETVEVDLIKFNNGDSVDGKPATPRMFSVGIVVQRNASLKHIRVVPEFRGIDGYNDFNTTELAADWDVGIWFQGANEASCYNVQASGYWRLIGTLLTENNGTFEQIANPERCIITRLRTQGVRGVAVRNSAQWRTFDDNYSSTSITCEYNQYWTLTSQNKFRLIGPYQIYQFSGYQVSPDRTKITLTGVTPNLPAVRPEILRSPSMGNNLAGTVFNDCVFASLEHSSGLPAKNLGLPEAAPFEFSGYPLRGLKLVNTKAQTTWDRIAGIFADCRDLKWANGQIENGLLVAYDNVETVGSTENLRFNNVYDESGNLDKALFNPRGFFNDYSSFPTEFSDGSLEIRPSKTARKNKVLRFRSDDGKIRAEFKNDGEDSFLRTGRNFSLNRDDGSSLITVFGGSGNATFAANVAPNEPNSGSSGAASLPWSAVHSTNGTIQPSDKRLKENGQSIPDAVFLAWQEVRQKIIMWMWKPEFKESDRFHFGPYAQDVIAAFEKHGENPFAYALNCYDKWDDEYIDIPAEFDEQGNEIKSAETRRIVEAGERYSIRKEEMFMLEIAYQVWLETK